MKQRRQKSKQWQKSKLTEDKGRSTYPHVKALAIDLGLSERGTREALRNGTIPHIKVGSRYILPRQAIQEWMLQAAARTAAA